MPITISAFYKFVAIADPPALRDTLHDRLQSRAIKGTILVAHEGVNGTISGAQDAMRAFLEELRADPRFADLVTKEARSDTHPFGRLKVKVKPEIVTFRQPQADPTRRVGTYVAPENWNALISEPGVLVIDTRNSYEFEAGTFDNAVDPQTRSFTEFPDYVRKNLDPARNRKIAMFCTGGIRCEKASAYMLAQGFSEVYHLEGGILNYLAKVPREDSRFRGACFVFDERRGVESDD
jgi:UPF0176 protein